MLFSVHVGSYVFILQTYSIHDGDICILFYSGAVVGGGGGGRSSWSSIPAYTQARPVLVRKNDTKAIITFLSGNIFYQKSCRRGEGG